MGAGCTSIAGADSKGEGIIAAGRRFGPGGGTATGTARDITIDGGEASSGLGLTTPTAAAFEGIGLGTISKYVIAPAKTPPARAAQRIFVFVLMGIRCIPIDASTARRVSHGTLKLMVRPFPTGYSAGPVSVQPATVLAPMAGVTDTVFRRLIRNQGGCGLIMTEFTSSHGVVKMLKARNPEKTKNFRYLVFEEEEHPISAQLFGSDPEVMANAARVCEELGFDAVDINFGCPVNKVVKCNGGSGLLRDLPLVENLLTSVKSAISIPLTMKFRAGWNDQELVHVQMAKLAEDCGVQAIALHPRTREQGYSGISDWTRIAEVKAAVKIPVIGNGDVLTPEDAVRMVRETNCDAVMIGRAAASNPWIFRQIAECLERGSYFQPSAEDRYEIMRKYYAMLIAQEFPDAVGKMKQFATYFTHGVQNGSKLRTEIHRAGTATQIVDQVDAFFSRELAVA